MPKRVKPNLSLATFPIHSLEDVDAALAQIAARKRQIDLIGLGVAEQVDEIKTRAAAETEPIRLEIAALELAIGRFAEASKAELFSKRSLYSSSSGSWASGRPRSSRRSKNGRSSACSRRSATPGCGTISE